MSDNLIPPVTEFGNRVRTFREPFISPAAHLFSWPTNTVGRSPTFIQPLRRVDITLVQSLIHSLRNTINDIDDAIEDARRVVDHLQAERQRFDQYLHHHRALLAPINRLPIELLAEIFLCVRGIHEAHSLHLPSVVAQVCQCWRSVAVATSRLWSTVVIRLDDWDPGRQIRRLHTWMERAGGCLIDLRVIGKRGAFGGGFGFPLQMVERLEDSLEPVPRPSARGFPLEAFARNPTDPDMEFTLAHALLCYSQRFESISFRTFAVRGDNFTRFSGHQSRTDATMYTFLAESAPNIENISIPFPASLAFFSFRTEKIRMIEGPFLSQQEFAAFWSGRLVFPNLAVAVIHMSFFPSRNTIPTFRTPLPPLASLTSLSLNLLSNNSFHDLPPMPALQHLIVIGMPPPTITQEYLEALLVFLQRVGQTLRYFGLSLRVESEPGLRRCLELMPSLEGLRLYHQCRDDDAHAVRLLTDVRLVPNLSHLELYGDLGQLANAVVDVAVSRTEVGRRGLAAAAWTVVGTDARTGSDEDTSFDLKHISLYETSPLAPEVECCSSEPERLRSLNVELAMRKPPEEPFDAPYFRERGLRIGIKLSSRR